jgi:hypothetical protein
LQPNQDKAFGGGREPPGCRVALVGYMYRDLVEKGHWISESDYKEGMALAQLMPGSLAAQLAIYLGSSTINRMEPGGDFCFVGPDSPLQVGGRDLALPNAPPPPRVSIGARPRWHVQRVMYPAVQMVC